MADSFDRQQTLAFAPGFSGARFRILQVDESMLTVGDRLFLKGAGDDDVVACSAAQTFELKLVENSNKMLLCVPPSAGGGTGAVICGEAQGCLEMRRTAPRLHRLGEMLLAADPLCAGEADAGGGGGAEGEGEGEGGGGGGEPTSAQRASKRARRRTQGVSFGELLDCVQASEAELRAGLAALHAVESPAGGRWRVLRSDYVAQVLESILAAATGLDLKSTDAPLELDALCAMVGPEMHSPAAVRAVALMHASHESAVLAERGSGSSGGSVRLDGAKVAARVGLQLLEACSASAVAATAPLVLALAPPGANLSLPPVEIFGIKPTATVRTTGAGVGAGASASATAMPRGVRAADFLRDWQRRVELCWPTSTVCRLADSTPTVALEMMRGSILLEGPPGEQHVQSFPQWRLHYEPGKRFRQLFAVRARWTKEDIRPFLEGICNFETKLDDLLVAHARMTIGQDGARFFSAR
jgi:hypothetical protein